MSERKIESVRIENIKGIQEIEFRVGALTAIAGDNGVGKTSVLDALLHTFEGGHDPSLIRQGAERGSIEIRLNDGTVIRRVITPRKSDTTILSGDGLKVSKPAEFLSRLASGFGLDPIGLIEADKKSRAKFLAEASPLKFTAAEICEITEQMPKSDYTLDQLMQLRDGIYQRRRDHNVRADQIAKFIAGLKGSIDDVGDDTEETVSAEAARVADELQAAQEAKAKAVGRINGCCQSDINKAVDGINGQIEALEQQIADLKQARAESVTSIKDTWARVLQNETEQIAAAVQEKKSELEAIDVRVARVRKAAQIKQQIEDNEAEWSHVAGEATDLDDQIKAIDALKTRKLAESAIPGIEVRDGEVFVDGIPFDQLNTQRQYFVAFQIAALKTGELGLMICDRMESIVGEQLTQFEAAAAQSGYQVIYARAEAEKPLTIEADGEPAKIKREAPKPPQKPVLVGVPTTIYNPGEAR